MTSQLDERPAQVLTSSPNRNESPSRSRTWMVAAAVVAVLALGAGLIIAVARTDGDRSPAAKPEQADASVLGVNGGVLPAHLEEFEARVEAGHPWRTMRGRAWRATEAAHRAASASAGRAQRL